MLEKRSEKPLFYGMLAKMDILWPIKGGQVKIQKKCVIWDHLPW